jgi:single-strand DNA-binding protein
MSMITVIGNLVADPETKDAGGHKLAKLRLASNERIKDANGEWKDSDTTYIDVTCWRKLAEGSTSLKKGQRVIVHGKLKGRSFQRKDGTNGYAYEIEANDIGSSIISKGSDSSFPTPKSEVIPDVDNPWGE